MNSQFRVQKMQQFKIPLHPIVDSINSPTHPLNKYIRNGLISSRTSDIINSKHFTWGKCVIFKNKHFWSEVLNKQFVKIWIGLNNKELIYKWYGCFGFKFSHQFSWVIRLNFFYGVFKCTLTKSALKNDCLLS